MLVNVVSPQWELHKAGWEKSAMAQLHKWAFYWANQSGSPRFGLLPRKHSLEGVSPYPCAWTERSQYYHYPALTLSPPLSFFLCFLLMLFLVSSSWSRSTLLPSSSLFFALACILHFSLPSHDLLLFTHSPAKQIAIRKLWSEETCHIVPPHWLYAPQISCDSFLLHCLPAWRRKQSYCNHIQICSIWNGHSSVPSFFRLIYFVVYNVCCYSSEYWFENEDQMEKVIMDTEMFMTRNKQELALKYHKSQPLPLTSISGWNVGHIFLFWVRSRSCWNLKWLQKNRWKKFLLFTTSSLYILQNEVIYN